MLVRVVGVKGGHIGVELRRVHSARMRGQGDHLVAGEFDGSALVDVDVSGLGGDHRLMPAQQRGDHHAIGLRAAGEKMHIRVRAAELADPVGGAAAPEVPAVARLGDQVALGQRLEDLGMAALRIIAQKVQHG